jgi:hypothetical protein
MAGAPVRLKVLAIIAALWFVGTVFGDDGSLSVSFEGAGTKFVQRHTHKDAEPFKGWLAVNVTNSGSVSWGGFHFQIVDVGFDVSEVDFIAARPYEPTSVQKLNGWAIDNNVVGARMDLNFRDDPVLPGGSSSFAIYTDNTRGRNSFGIELYPTPVPAVVTMAQVYAVTAAVMLAIGLAGFWRRRRRAVKAAAAGQAQS